MRRRPAEAGERRAPGRVQVDRVHANSTVGRLARTCRRRAVPRGGIDGFGNIGEHSSAWASACICSMGVTSTTRRHTARRKPVAGTLWCGARDPADAPSPSTRSRGTAGLPGGHPGRRGLSRTRRRRRANLPPLDRVLQVPSRCCGEPRWGLVVHIAGQEDWVGSAEAHQIVAVVGVSERWCANRSRSRGESARHALFRRWIVVHAQNAG